MKFSCLEKSISWILIIRCHVHGVTVEREVRSLVRAGSRVACPGTVLDSTEERGALWGTDLALRQNRGDLARFHRHDSVAV